MKQLNEAHGCKKHNCPKNELSAIRKGNRDAEKEIYGDGFKSKNKIHKSSKKDSKPEKVNIRNYDKFIEENHIKLSSNDLSQIVKESVKQILTSLNEGMTTDNPMYNKWFEAKEMLGAEQMLDAIWHYLDVSQLEQIIGWLNQDYELWDDEEEEDDDLYESKSCSLKEEDNGGEVNWGENIESLISKLEKKFSSVIASEEDEYGISNSPLHNLIMHLKYYYDHNIFDNACFSAIYKMLDNYDFTSDEEIRQILSQLKKYCQ